MVANYTFVAASLATPRTNPALTATASIACVRAPHASTPANDILAVLRAGAATPLSLYTKGSDSANYYNGTPTVLSGTNTGQNNNTNNALVYAPGATAAEDLLIASASDTTAANNVVNLLPRTGGGTPFPGAATVDNVNRYQLTNANMGGTANLRQIALATGSTLANDLLVLTFSASDAQIIPRGAGATPFPGAASPGAGRIVLTRTNIFGSNLTLSGCCFLPHPTTPSENLLAFSGGSGVISLVRQGSGATPFPGGTLGVDRFVGPSVSTLGAKLSFAPSPVSPAQDLLIISTSSAVFFVPRGTGLPGFTGPAYLSLSPGTTSIGQSGFLYDSTPRDSIIAIPDNLAGRVNFYRAWEATFQPTTISPTEIQTAVATSPIFLNASDVTIDAPVTYFQVDRRMTALITLLNRGYTWTRDTEATATLSTDLIFSTNTAAITGEYRLTMGASTKVRLHSKSIYDEKITLPSTGILEITANSEITDDFILVAGTTVNKVGAGPYTLTIPYPDPGLVLGTGVVLDAPVNEIAISGIPDVTGNILAVQNLTTSAISYPTLVGGAVTIELDAGTNYKFIAKAPGYERQSVTLSGTTAAFEFSLTSYVTLYSGAASTSEIAVNYTTKVLTVGDSDPTLTFLKVLSRLEDLFSTEAGVLFDYPPEPVVVASRNYLLWPYDSVADAPNPYVYIPDPTNATDPTLSNFTQIKLGATDAIWDLFDFSGAGGRFIRINSESVSVTSGGGSGDAPTEAQIYTYFIAGTRANAFKADVSNLSTFDPATDPVNVDRVAGVDVDGPFDPATDTVRANVTQMSTDVIDANAIAASAIAEIKGLSSADREVIDAIALRTVDLPALIEDSDGKRFKAKALEAAPAPSGGGSGLGPEDIERLERIEQQLIADVSKGRDRYQRLLPGTSTVILDKDVIYDPETGFTLTEHEEPPP